MRNFDHENRSLFFLCFVVLVAINTSVFACQEDVQDDQPGVVGNDLPENSLQLGLRQYAEELRLEAEEEERIGPLKGREEVVVRAIEFVLSTLTEEEYSSAIGEMFPEQQRNVERYFNEYKQAVKEINDSGEKFATAFEQKHGRPPTDREMKQDKDRSIWIRHQQLANNLKSELLVHQQVAVAKWSPDLYGITNTLTNTPIGSALGLNEKQKEELHNRSFEIGDEFRKAWKKSQDDMEKLYSDILTDEQAAKLKGIYYTTGTQLRGFVPSMPGELLFKLPYEKYKDSASDAGRRPGQK